MTTAMVVVAVLAIWGWICAAMLYAMYRDERKFAEDMYQQARNALDGWGEALDGHIKFLDKTRTLIDKLPRDPDDETTTLLH